MGWIIAVSIIILLAVAGSAAGVIATVLLVRAEQEAEERGGSCANK